HLLGERGGQRREIHALIRPVNLAAFGSRQYQQLIHHLRQLVELLQLASQNASVLLDRLSLQQRYLCFAPQRGQRGSQFVRNTSRELFHLVHGILQPRQRIVERPGHFVHLIASPAN